ncbi:MAG: cation diffusion facilitator family transporter [Sulfurospirillaceae bacterium]|nr:cation diffusion facilitator family transporter [Sulfurospirillaceae bacterium]MDD2825723.1 cation diffusion facilitator family transporter [Sulfurospirillaceae bacterium]
MEHHHEHHDHDHHHHHEVTGKNLFITIILNVFITVAQIIGGIISGSLALLSDALHNFSDVMALLIAWWANKVSSRSSSAEKTFGYKRAEIVAALFNASVLTGTGIYLIVEGISKFIHPEVIDSDIVIYLAILGIIFNFGSVLLIQKDAHDNLNMKAAYMHMISDVMTSVAVLMGGLGMKYFGAFWIDPLITIVIALYLIQTSFSLIKETTSILMQFSPKHLHVKEIEAMVLEFVEIKNLHHVHLWRLNDKEIHLEAHLDFKNDVPLSEATRIVETIEEELEEHFGITHVTLQAEFDKDDHKDLVYNQGCHHV